MKKFVRWPVFVLLAVLLVTGIVATVPLLHGTTGKAHTAGTPAVTLSPNVGKPEQILTVTGQGFAPGEYVQLMEYQL